MNTHFKLGLLTQQLAEAVRRSLRDPISVPFIPSYTMADAVWLQRQLGLWRAVTEASVSRSSLEEMQVVAFHFDVWYGGHPSAAGLVLHGQVSLLDRLDDALAEHGNPQGCEDWRRRSLAGITKMSTLRAYARHQRRTRLLEMVNAVNLTASWNTVTVKAKDTDTVRCDVDRGGLRLWWHDGRWSGKTSSGLSSGQQAQYARLHDLINADCDGRCGWGGCGQPAEVAVRDRGAELCAVLCVIVSMQCCMRC